MIIPYDLLSPEALQGVIEAFVTQEGTDYGQAEWSLQVKVVQVRAQLETGLAVIVYDEADQTCTILPKEQVANRTDDGEGQGR